MMAVMVVAMVSFPPLLSFLFLTPPILLLICSHIGTTIRQRYIQFIENSLQVCPCGHSNLRLDWLFNLRNGILWAKDTLGAVETAMAMNVACVMMVKIRITRRVLVIFKIMKIRFPIILVFLVMMVMVIMAVAAVEMPILMLVVMNRQGYSRWRRFLFVLGSGILSLSCLFCFSCPLIVSTCSGICLFLLVVAAMTRFRASSSSRSPVAVTLAPARKVSDGGDDDYNEGDSDGEANCR